MDKDLIKGFLILALAVVVIVGIVYVSAPEGGDKAKCIANALKEHYPLSKIDQLCRLTETRPTH